MRVIAKSTLRAFWQRHPDSESALQEWYAKTAAADWDTPAAVRSDHRTASILPGNRAVFNIKGNTYRLVVNIVYPRRVVYIRFIGTHAEYDRINAAEV